MKNLLILVLSFSCYASSAQVENKENSNTQSMDWSIPKFYFSVEFGSSGIAASFQEVSGLGVETQPIEYRHGDSKTFSTIKMPGIKKYGNVTLKMGIFTRDNKFWNWMKSIQSNTIERETITIKLLDEEGNPTMTWTLTNAFPTKISSSDLNATDNEAAVETLEIAHEGLAIKNGG